MSFSQRKVTVVFTFLTKTRGINFPDAVKELAQNAGIEIPDDGPDDEAARARAKERERLFELMGAAADWFRRNLKEAREAAPARDYAAQRGLDEGTQEKFRLGFAPRDIAGLVKGALSKGWSESDLERVGLMQRNDRGSYGRFRSRLMFPIEDGASRVVGFGGRVIGQGEPKYLNSPETELFVKGRLLYGLPQAKQAMLKRRQAILCEGYMDAIACHQAGVDFAVAGLGTALTTDHGRQLKRYVEEVYLVYDTDRAGLTAARRASEILLDEGLTVKVVRLGKHKDPDDYLKAEGKEAFMKLLPESLDAPAFFIEEGLAIAMSNHEVARPADLNLKVKVDVMQGLFPLLAKYATNIESGAHLREAAARLGLPPEEVQADYEAFRKGKAPRGLRMKAREAEVSQSSALVAIENELIQLLVRHPQLREGMIEAMPKPEFSDPDQQAAAELLWKYPDQSVMGIELKEEGSENFTRGIRVIREASMADEGFSDPAAALNDLLERRRLERLKRRKAVVDVNIQSLQASGEETDPDELVRLMAESQRLAQDMEKVKVRWSR